MNDQALPALKRLPPGRETLSPLGRGLEATLRLLNRLIRKRHPAGFDFEVGSFEFPDVNITRGAGGNMPRPLISRDCDKGVLVYCFVSNPTDRCSFLGQLIALFQAIDQVAQYLRDEFQCKNPCCLQEAGELVWFGLDCGRATGPSDDAAVLVRFRCIPEL
jgi:hypothetical protein